MQLQEQKMQQENYQFLYKNILENIHIKMEELKNLLHRKSKIENLHKDQIDLNEEEAAEKNKKVNFLADKIFKIHFRSLIEEYTQASHDRVAHIRMRLEQSMGAAMQMQVSNIKAQQLSKGVRIQKDEKYCEASNEQRGIKIKEANKQIIEEFRKRKELEAEEKRKREEERKRQEEQLQQQQYLMYGMGGDSQR